MEKKISKAFIVAVPPTVCQFQKIRIGTLKMPQGTFIKGKQGLLASERHWHEPHRLHCSTSLWSKIAKKKWHTRVLALLNVWTGSGAKTFFFYLWMQIFLYNCSSRLNCGKAGQTHTHTQKSQHSFFSTTDLDRLYLKEKREEKTSIENLCLQKRQLKTKLLRLYWTTTFSLEAFLQATQLYNCQRDRIIGRFSLLS